MNIHVYHSKTIFHLFEYLKYLKNKKIMQLLYKCMKIKFYTKFVQTFETW
jgi:hypothetical protein